MMLPAFDRDMSSASDEQLLKVVGLIDTLDRRGPVDRLLSPSATGWRCCARRGR